MEYCRAVRRALGRADLALRVGYGDRGGNSGNEFLAGAEARVPVADGCWIETDLHGFSVSLFWAH